MRRAEGLVPVLDAQGDPAAARGGDAVDDDRRVLHASTLEPLRLPRIRAAYGAYAPLAVLGRRFASGEIDGNEYRRRPSVLDERFGRSLGDGAA
ncbi:hypothetical protein GCM10017750_62270 [Streptomyces racemochromogenes]